MQQCARLQGGRQARAKQHPANSCSNCATTQASAQASERPARQSAAAWAKAHTDPPCTNTTSSGIHQRATLPSRKRRMPSRLGDCGRDVAGTGVHQAGWLSAALRCLRALAEPGSQEVGGPSGGLGWGGGGTCTRTSAASSRAALSAPLQAPNHARCAHPRLHAPCCAPQQGGAADRAWCAAPCLPGRRTCQAGARS